NWLIAHTIYKVNDSRILEQIENPTVKQTKTSYVNILAISVTFGLAKLLEFIDDYFSFQTPLAIKFLIFPLFPLLIIFLRFYISKINQSNLNKVIKLDYLQKDRIWIRPQSIFHFFGYILFYSFIFLALALGIYFYFEYGNLLALI